jgi:hypothetical protein
MEGAARGCAAEEHGARLSRARNWDGTLERIQHALYVAQREEEGREASPTVAIIDSQTAKGAQKRGLGLSLRATMAPSTCCGGRDDYSRSSSAFLLTADTRDARWQ